MAFHVTNAVIYALQTLQSDPTAGSSMTMSHEHVALTFRAKNKQQLQQQQEEQHHERQLKRERDSE